MAEEQINVIMVVVMYNSDRAGRFLLHDIFYDTNNP